VTNLAYELCFLRIKCQKRKDKLRTKYSRFLNFTIKKVLKHVCVLAAHMAAKSSSINPTKKSFIGLMESLISGGTRGGKGSKTVYK
jgi:hypothetical protein